MLQTRCSWTKGRQAARRSPRCNRIGLDDGLPDDGDRLGGEAEVHPPRPGEVGPASGATAGAGGAASWERGARRSASRGGATGTGAGDAPWRVPLWGRGADAPGRPRIQPSVTEGAAGAGRPDSDRRARPRSPRPGRPGGHPDRAPPCRRWSAMRSMSSRWSADLPGEVVGRVEDAPGLGVEGLSGCLAHRDILHAAAAHPGGSALAAVVHGFRRSSSRTGRPCVARGRWPCGCRRSRRS